MLKYNGIPAGYESDSDEEDLEFLNAIPQQLKIRVVPSITAGAGLNGNDFDCQLPADVEAWFTLFRDQWNAYKRTPSAVKNLQHVLSQYACPLRLTLKLFANCPGCSNIKSKSLELFILETLCAYYKQKPQIAADCTDNLRMVAFNFVKTCGIASLYKDIIETYGLRQICDLLVPKLKELIANGHYKDAAYWAMYLDVTAMFSIFDIAFPLILQDKVLLAEEYLEVAKEQQLPMVQFLDTLLDKQKTVGDHCQDVIIKLHYETIQYNTLTSRPLIKLVTRLVKKYRLDAQVTPHLNFSKACKYIHYFYHKYDDGGMSCDAWREVVCDAANTKLLQLDLVSYLAGNGNLEEAVYWVKFFKISHNDCPSVLQGRLASSDTVDAAATTCGSSSQQSASAPKPLTSAVIKATGSNANTRQEFLSLNLPDESIILVDTKQKFLDMLAFLEQQSLIAFDAEWKPSVCTNNDVSLLQLATMERVYLLDCLSSQLTEDLWKLLGRKILNNLEILKVGFALNQDLGMLDQSLSLQLNLQANCYLDMRKLWHRLICMDIVSFSKRFGKSLSAMTEACLGKKLDKSNQCSNWEKRPLRPDQIVYAALDAHCLLQIYKVLEEILANMGFDIERVVDEVTTAKTGYLYRMKCAVSLNRANAADHQDVPLAHSIRTAAESCDTNSLRVADVKVICDTMLLSLAKELRKLGIDCLEINTMNVCSCIEVVLREKRVLLTQENRLTKFTSDLPPAQCIEVQTENLDRQVLQVLRCLKINVQDRDLFTRCLSCNGNEFILAHQKDMELMRSGQAEANNSGNVKSVPSTLKVEQRHLNMITINEHIITSRKTPSGKTIKLRRIKPHLLRSKEHFFICDNCGDCTWNGMHTIHTSIMKVITSNPQ